MTGDLTRGGVLYRTQAKRIEPMHGIIVWVWNRKDLDDLMAYIAYTHTITTDQQVLDSVAEITDTAPYQLINISNQTAPLYIAWIYQVTLLKPGDPALFGLSRMVEIIAEPILNTCAISGYDPTDGFKMYRALMSDVFFCLGQVLNTVIKGRLTYASEACRYLQQNVSPSTLSELHAMSVVQIESMVRDEQMRSDQALVIWGDDGDWGATTYFN